MTRFYLHNAANAASDGAIPGSKAGNSPTYSLANSATLRTADTNIGTAQVGESGTTSATTSQQTGDLGWWVSPPLAAQTLPASQAITINFAIDESNTNVNLGDYYAYIRIQHLASGFDTILNNNTTGGAEPTATSSEQVSQGTATGVGSSISIAAGDRLVIELQLVHTQGMATAYTVDGYYDGTTATTTNNTVVSNHAAFVDFTGYTFSFSGSQTLNAAAGSYAVTGSAATLSVAHTINAAAGSYAVTGSAATLTLGHTLAANAGSYAVTGSAITDPVTLSMNAAAGSYAVTGSAATLPVGHVINAASGAYSVTGFDTTLPVAHAINAAAGSYAVTGSASTQTIACILNLASGAYALTGADATLTLNASGVSYNLAANAGSYALAGLDATLTGPAPAPVAVTPSGGIHHKAGYRRVIQLKSGEQLIANSETEFREIIQSLIAEKTAPQEPKSKPKISRKIRQRVKTQRKLQEFTDYESLFRRLDELQNSLISEQLLLEMIATSASVQALLAEEDREIDFILSVI